MSSDRMKNYKKGVTLEETRRHREETTIQIRKNKREEQLMKRRNRGVQQAAPQLQAMGMAPPQPPMPGQPQITNGTGATDPNILQRLQVSSAPHQVTPLRRAKTSLPCAPP